MFGEYGLHCDGMMVAIVAADLLFIKPTCGRCMGKRLRARTSLPRRQPHLPIDAERWDDSDWLRDLVRTTAAELPLPQTTTCRKNHEVRV